MSRGSEIRNITLIGFMGGILYTLLADDLSDPAPVINAFLIGTIGGFLAGVVELNVFRPRFRRPEFALTVVLKVFTYFLLLSLLILLIKGRVDSYFKNEGFVEYLKGEEFRFFILEGEFKIILLYAFSLIILIIFTMQVSKYLGKGVLTNLITGKYHDPKYEKRILLLIDIKGSTGIAEKLDPILYFKLLDRFYFDVHAGVRPFLGAIYRYVGDQVTITWSVSARDNNANCIRSFFQIRHQIHMNREIYLNQFGFVPSFKGTAHVGRVLTGEIGDVKSQIVFYGAPLLEVAKMEKSIPRSPEGLCISDELLSILQLPPMYRITPVRGVQYSEKREIGMVEVEDISV